MSGIVSNRVVTNGLVLYLDAANPNSYPGSGNTWYDLSRSNSNFTLYNSPTYDGTSLSFNGTDQYALANNISTGNFGTGDFTMEFLTNVTAVSYIGSVFSKRWFDAVNGTYGGGGWNWRASNAGQGGPSLISNASPELRGSTQPLPSYNTIYHGCATITRSGVSATITTYVNNILKEITTGNLSNASIDNTVSNLALMAGKQGAYYLVTGKLYMARLYNRALTATEVSQNYNTLKSRFGL